MRERVAKFKQATTNARLYGPERRLKFPRDFLLGPAIVSVLFPLAIVRIYKAYSDQIPINLSTPPLDMSTDLDQALRFAQILMNVGLFWFFWQSWAEKAGYLSNPHSSDEIDLPFEFGGTMLGFWMARVLTKPFDHRSEKFRSTFFIDFLSSGVIGLLYTLIVGPLIEGVASAVGAVCLSAAAARCRRVCASEQLVRALVV